MSAVDGRVLVTYQGGAVIIDVSGVVADGGVPGDGDGLTGELEWDGPLDGAGGAVAGLPGAEDLLGVFYRYFDGPPGGVPFDDLRGGRGGVGGDQGQVVAGGGAVADEYYGDRAGAEDRVPQASDRGGADGGGLAVAGSGYSGERRGSGELRQGGEPVSLLAGTAAPAGAPWREGVQGGVLAQPGGPGDAGRELLQLAARRRPSRQPRGWPGPAARRRASASCGRPAIAGTPTPCP